MENKSRISTVLVVPFGFWMRMEEIKGVLRRVKNGKPKF